MDERQLAWSSLGRGALLPILAEEWDRAKFIDEKLFKLTTALSLAVAAVGVASKAVLDALPAGPLKAGVTAVLLYAIVSLFVGTLMGFSGLRPKPRAGYGPDFALQIRHDNKHAAERIADALKDFEIKNIIRANEASAANMAIRNGVIAFALAMTFSLFLPPKREAPVTPNIRQINIDMRAPNICPDTNKFQKWRRLGKAQASGTCTCDGSDGETTGGVRNFTLRHLVSTVSDDPVDD